MDVEQSRVLTLVFTDLVGSTALKTERGDVVVGALITRHREYVTELAKRFSGRIIDWAGDGCFSTFQTPSAALQFALSLQQAHAEEGDLPDVRIGLHMGEVTEKPGPEGDAGPPRIEGLAVDLAARISGLAQPRQVLMSTAVFDNTRQRLSSEEFGTPIAWRAHGAYELKGVDNAMDICEAGIEGVSLLEPPPGSEKAHRAVTPAEEDTLGWRPAAGLAVPRRDHWILQGQLGEGGYGEVWLGAHDKTKAQRVFKFCFEPERVRGLKREVVLFRLLKESLGHRDDIAQILEWEFERPPYFIEAEYTEGGDLKQWANEQGGIGAVPLETRLELVAQAAVALGAAHSVGVLHKDIKPANILIAEVKERGVPRASLTDFGIGLITDPGALLEKGISAAGLTQTLVSSGSSSGSGTRLYMAPEAVEGKPSTTLSDVYALGVVLYQMVIGDFSRSVAAGWERDVDDELLREDIAACVEGDPERRLGSAPELAERLRTLKERRALRQAQEKGQRRRRLLAFVSATTAILAAIVGGIAFREYQRAEIQTGLRLDADMQRREAETQHQEAVQAQARERVAREEAEYGQYVSNIQLAAMRLDQGSAMLARPALLATPPHLRNWEWGYLVNEAWPRRAVSEEDADSESSRAASTADIWREATARVVVELEGHSGLILGLEFDSKGERLVSGSFDGTARVWDTQTGEALAAMATVKGPVYDAAFSHDGARVITAYVDGPAAIWDAATGRRLRTLSLGRSANGRDVAFSPDGAIAACMTADGTLATYDAASGRLLSETPGGGTMRFSPDGRQIMTAWDDGTVRSLDASTGETINTFTLPIEEDVSSLKLSPDLKALALGFRAGRITVWDLEAQAVRFTVAGHTNAPGLGFSPDNTCLRTASSDGIAKVWDALTGAELANIPIEGVPVGGAFSPGGRRVAMASSDNAIRIWSVVKLRDVRETGVLRGHTDIVYGADFSPDGSRLATASYDKTAKVWDSASGDLLLTLAKHDGELAKAEFSHDGSHIMTTSIDGKERRFWDAVSGEAVSALLSSDASPRIDQVGGIRDDPALHISAVSYTGFRESAGRVVRWNGKALEVVDWSSGTAIAELEQQPSAVIWAGFVDDTSLLATSGDGSVYLWEAETGRHLYTLAGHEAAVMDAAHSPDRSRILTTSLDRTAKIWDAATGAEIMTLSGHESFLFTGRFSPDGSRILTTSADNTAKLWDAATGKLLVTLSGHTGMVNGGEFSPDGSRIMTQSGAGDFRAKIWDLEGNELVTLSGESELVYVLWNPNGRQVATTWRDGTARLYDAVPWPALAAIGGPDTPFEDRLRIWRQRQSQTISD